MGLGFVSSHSARLVNTEAVVAQCDWARSTCRTRETAGALVAEPSSVQASRTSVRDPTMTTAALSAKRSWVNPMPGALIDEAHRGHSNAGTDACSVLSRLGRRGCGAQHR